MERYIRFFLLAIMMVGFNSRALAAAHAYIIPVERDDVSSIAKYPDPARLGNTPCDGETYTYYENHEGVDYMTAIGSSVYAAAAGTVHRYTQVDGDGEFTGYGQYIGINHGAGNWTLYAHLDSYVAADGATVSQGERIAYSGITGTSSAHLHFEVLTDVGTHPANGTAQNPYYCNDEWFTTSPPLYADDFHTYICTTSPVNDYADTPVWETMITVDEDGDNFDLHAYYLDDDELVLLNRGDMGSEFANPVINDQGQTDSAQEWLVGDVDGDNWDDVVMIAHPDSGTVRVNVWYSNGDGSFQDRENVNELSGHACRYFLGDIDNDADADLILATQGSDEIVWEYCRFNGSSFNTCSTWSSDFGSSILDDVFLVGDVSGDGKVDIVRGYNTDDTVEPCETGGYKLKWRVLKGGSTSPSTWLEDWGCYRSRYVLGNMDGQYGQDLVHIRYDDSSTGHVFVATSNSAGSAFSSTSEWHDDIGSGAYPYYTYNMNDDSSNRDDLLCHYGYSSVYLATSNGSSLSNEQVLSTSVNDRVLFGNFGEIYLLEGTHDETVCEEGPHMAEFEPFENGDLLGDENSSEVYVYLDGSFHWVTSSSLFSFCGYDWDDIVEVSADYLDTLSFGDDLSDPFECQAIEEGDLLHASDGKIYLAENGTLRWITSSAVYAACNFGSATYTEISDTVLAGATIGNSITNAGECNPYDNGYLIRGETDRRVYVFWDQELRWIRSSSVFSGCGYSWSAVHSTSQSVVDVIDKGDSISSTDNCTGTATVSYTWTSGDGYSSWIRDTADTDADGDTNEIWAADYCDLDLWTATGGRGVWGFTSSGSLYAQGGDACSAALLETGWTNLDSITISLEYYNPDATSKFGVIGFGENGETYLVLLEYVSYSSSAAALRAYECDAENECVMLDEAQDASLYSSTGSLELTIDGDLWVEASGVAIESSGVMWTPETLGLIAWDTDADMEFYTISINGVNY